MTIDMAAGMSRSLFLFWSLVPPGARSEPVPVTLSIEGHAVPTTIGVTDEGRRDLWGLPGVGIPAVVLRSWTYLEATLETGGGSQTLLVLDEDLDGRFGSEGDAWTLAFPGEEPVRSRGPELNAMGASSFKDGQRFSVTVDGDEVEVTVAKAESPDPVSEAANRDRVERIWFDQFDLDREAFVVERGVDTSRPRDKDSIEWSYVTFDQGLAMAGERGKLLFADVRHFSGVWCY